jgi:hypothetical protein
MKILIPCSCIDLRYKLGCTPSWWQLFKSLHESGNEVIITPYLGDPVESLWWRTYCNPCSLQSKVYNLFLDRKKEKSGIANRNKTVETVTNAFGKLLVHDKWERHLCSIIEKEKDIDAVLFINIPIDHIKGIPNKIREEYGLPVAYYDGDMPTILPKYARGRGFKFNYYVNADLSEFDTFFTNSKGVVSDLENLKARNVQPLYYAIDPNLFSPVELQKSIDISFYGHGSELREKWMTDMISIPSKRFPKYKFCVGGKGFDVDLGIASKVGAMSYSSMRDFCCRSHICLNITRSSHTAIYASSTARPFELAGYGACIISHPYEGIGEWFDVNKEIVVVNNQKEIDELYQFYLDNPESALKMGQRARSRVLKDHTYVNRANSIVRELKKGMTG